MATQQLKKMILVISADSLIHSLLEFSRCFIFFSQTYINSKLSRNYFWGHFSKRTFFSLAWKGYFPFFVKGDDFSSKHPEEMWTGDYEKELIFRCYRKALLLSMRCSTYAKRKATRAQQTTIASRIFQKSRQ